MARRWIAAAVVAWCAVGCTSGAGDAGDTAADAAETSVIAPSDAADMAAASAVDAEVATDPCAAYCDDGNACTIDACTGYGCSHVPANCADADDCTAETCDPASGCTFALTVSGPKPSCHDSDDCTFDACVVGLGCAPTLTISGPMPSCHDADDCTADACVIGSGCTHTPTVSGAKPSCDDGIACTLDQCVPGLGCTHDVGANGPLAPCDDGIACTVDSCGGTVGCLHAPNAASCADDDACTTDLCAPATGCVHISSCDDGDPCTADTCAPVTLACAHTAIADGGSCSACSGAVCFAGVCTGNADPCFDSDPCTEDLCDAASAMCWHKPKPCNLPTPQICLGGGDCDCVTPPGAAMPCTPYKAWMDCTAASTCVFHPYCPLSWGMGPILGLCVPPDDLSAHCPAADGSGTICFPLGCKVNAATAQDACAPCVNDSACPNDTHCYKGQCVIGPVGPPCSSNLDCADAAFCSATGCMADVCNGPRCIDDRYGTDGGKCLTCAADGSGYVGKPIDCSDGDPCTWEAWSPSAGCSHGKKADFEPCAVGLTMWCQKGLCVAP